MSGFAVWLLALLAPLSALLGLLAGSSLEAGRVLEILFFGGGEAAELFILVDIRLPRVLLAGLVGAGIAAAGAALQGLFRNPLADPSLIGVSSGAAFAACLFIVFWGAAFGPAAGQFGMSGAAFAGGLLTALLVLAVASRSSGLAGILLAGIAINAVALAGVAFLSYLATDSQLRSLTFWALGSFNGAGWRAVGAALPLTLAALLLLPEAKRLNAATLGEENAGYLGVHFLWLRLRILVLSALVVGISVALAGIITFVGLIVPHLVRALVSSDHRILIGASALGGASLLIIADALSRTLLAPAELPVGILTAVVGGCFFLLLLVRHTRIRLSL